MKKDLSSFYRSFLVQGTRYTLGGLALLAIPFLTYAKAATVQFNPLGGVFDSQLVFFLLYFYVGLHAILFGSLGLLILFGGTAYVRHAQGLLDKGIATRVLLDLKSRKNKFNLNGGTLLDGVVTYGDGSQESFKFFCSQKSETLMNLIAQSTQVDLFGEPKSNPKPRVLSTPYGLLLEQPNELGMIQSIFGFSDKTKFLERRVKVRLLSLSLLTIAYLVFFSPISLNLQIFTEQAKPVLSVIVIASMLLCLADFLESRKLVLLKQSCETVDCQFSFLKSGILKCVNPKFSTVNVVFRDGRDPQKTTLILESFNNIFDEKPIYGSAYLDQKGRIIGIVNGATTLVRSKVAYWTMIPVVLYLVTFPLYVLSMKPDMSKEFKYKSGQEYYRQGLAYKAYGWTEKARKSMFDAQQFDSQTADKAKSYIRTHLPLFPISKDAEQMNIKGYNLMVSRKADDAIKAFKECIAKYPKFEWPYGNLGSLYMKQGDYKNAKLYLDKAIDINPDYVNALHHLAELELRQGNREKALEYLDKIAIVDPYESQVGLQEFAIKTSL